ncbi:hypothetical protein N7474_005409 [Penicillium riverlandense]|uniref:uncharacterized protein n=1 Tax=Penicillium riverlandense TaxID=1903569 RepID=UPI002548162C|nr:uncharacterized protein N7474_005409 [Penicillium riverlandense]KAJ5819818.1 hypothetical protein N7474_005409 [Penicillium riverlandense]
MVGLDYRHGISVLEVIVYIPTLIIALWVAYRHGFQRSAGWITLVIFSLVRVVGSCCYLATLGYPSSKDLYVAWAVCSSIGLSPLTISCIGLLSRANGSIKQPPGQEINQRLFKWLGLATLVAVILSIVGQVQNTNLGQESSISTLTKAGVVIFLVTWAGLAFLLFGVASRFGSIEDGERRLVFAVGLSVPLLLVRILYSLLAVFSHSPDFNMFTGSPTIMLVMAVLEEIAICVICLGTGITLSVRKRTDYNEEYALVR